MPWFSSIKTSLFQSFFWTFEGSKLCQCSHHGSPWQPCPWVTAACPGTSLHLCPPFIPLPFPVAYYPFQPFAMLPWSWPVRADRLIFLVSLLSFLSSVFTKSCLPKGNHLPGSSFTWISNTFSLTLILTTEQCNFFQCPTLLLPNHSSSYFLFLSKNIVFGYTTQIIHVPPSSSLPAVAILIFLHVRWRLSAQMAVLLPSLGPPLAEWLLSRGLSSSLTFTNVSISSYDHKLLSFHLSLTASVPWGFWHTCLVVDAYLPSPNSSLFSWPSFCPA